jgi:hypothetical protein
VSAIIALALPGGSGQPPLLHDLGYELRSLELPMTDHLARPYTLDLHLSHHMLNLSLLVDCKTDPTKLKATQIERYMATGGSDLIIAANFTPPDPRQHRVDVVFFVLQEVESQLSALVATCASRLSSGWGIIRVSSSRMEMAHDELTDSDLSRSLTTEWEVAVDTLPLERLPYESDSPSWELASVIFQTIQSLFVSGTREFGVEELCVASNGL